MISAEFLLQDSFGKIWIFEEAFLLSDTNMEVILEMPFLSHSNIDFQFSARELNWRSYTTAETLLTARQGELIDKHKFIKTALNENSEMFVVYVVVLNNLDLVIYLL